ncbi:hypothetical protein [Actinopolyspora saharensis]|uniref:Uncharacterized protein n=1 Tax=Actinopolyspora saharensis TaxID=995062 RepID=A0A1H1D4Y4_9ACTN|nr:hypothetical protein [Actinopolyspora saharensis]SDQ70886.1 hypothetical protein SAMN04489718_1874 [Actinopolyspora saharensis]
MDPLYDDPDARPRRLAVLAGFGIIVATGFATIAAMALDDGQNQQDTALPDSVITTSSSTPPGSSADFRTADGAASGASRPESSRDSPAESSGGDVPVRETSPTGPRGDTEAPEGHPAPGDSEGGDDGSGGDDGNGGGSDDGGNSDDSSGDQDSPNPTGTAPPENSDEDHPTEAPPESSTSSESSSSESEPAPPPSDSSSSDPSSRAVSSGLSSTRESTEREPAA